MRQSNTNQPSSFTTSFQTVLKFVAADEDKTAPWNENMRRTLIIVYNIIIPALCTGMQFWGLLYWLECFPSSLW